MEGSAPTPDIPSTTPEEVGRGENTEGSGESTSRTVKFNEIDAQLLQELMAGHKGLHCTYTADNNGMVVRYIYDYQPMGNESYFRMVVEPESFEKIEVMGYTKNLGNGQGEQGTYIKLNPQLKMIYQQRLGKNCDWVFAKQTFEVGNGEWNEPAIHRVEITGGEVSMPEGMDLNATCEVVSAFGVDYFTPQGEVCGYEDLAASYGGS